MLVLSAVALAGMVPVPCAISLGEGPSRVCVLSDICTSPAPESPGAVPACGTGPAACGAPAHPASAEPSCGGPGQDADCASCVLCVCGISVLGAPVTLTARLQGARLPAAAPAVPAGRLDRPPAPPPRSG